MARHLLCALLLVATAIAQQAPTFTSHSNLVLVPVTVTHSNKHVGGLRQQDFRIFDDGQSRDVAFVEEVTGSTAPATKPVLPPSTYTNQPTANTAGHLTIFLLDQFNTEVIYQENARRQLIDFLRTRGAATGPLMLAVLRYDGLHIALNYSDSPEKLIQLVKGIKSDNRLSGVNDDAVASMNIRNADRKNPMEQVSNGSLLDVPDAIDKPDPQAAMTELTQRFRLRLQAEHASQTFEAVTQLANAVAAVPGRKTLVWLAGQVPFFGQESFFASRWYEAEEIRKRVLGALTAANIAVYPVQVAQSQNPAWTSPAIALSSYPRFPAPLGLTHLVQAAMDFSDNTGGKLCGYRSNLGDCFQKAIDDSSSYYLIGYYAGRARPGWHKIKVSVEAKGVKVRARRGYVQPDPREVVANLRSQISTALDSPLDFTTVPLTLRWKTTVSSGAELQVPFDLQLDARKLTLEADDGNRLNFDIVVLAFERATGKRAATISQTVNTRLSEAALAQIDAAGIKYTNQLHLSSGKYLVRVLVRDVQTGRIGTLTVPLDLQGN